MGELDIYEGLEPGTWEVQETIFRRVAVFETEADARLFLEAKRQAKAPDAPADAPPAPTPPPVAPEPAPLAKPKASSRKPSAGRAAKVAEIRRLAAKGLDRDDIAAQLDTPKHVVTRLANSEGIKILQGAEAEPDLEPRPEPEPDEGGPRKRKAEDLSKPAVATKKRRNCMTCGKTFMSEGAHNRMCTSCRKKGSHEMPEHSVVQ
ncbi:MAG: hypothetical protein AAF899_06695 [Pseudomonadota bacterium]